MKIPAGAGERATLLSHPNGWVRDTAQRLLVESAAPEAAAAASRAWAGQLLARWPARSGASRARRMYARCARHRLQQLAAGRTPQPGRQPLGQLWRVWRAASGGP